MLADIQSEVFDDQALQDAWKAFAGARKETAGEMEQLILHRTVRLGEGTQVLIQLRSTLEISILERFEHEMIAFLRKSLKNDTILLEKEILEEEQQTTKLYTSADKFDYLAAQNPDLKLLKERLGLDFEY